MDKSMLKYIGKRLLISAVTLFVILTVLFLMTRLMPGSPFNSEKLSKAQMKVVEAKYGLDKPVFVQYLSYLKNMVTGDFGVSYVLYKDQNVSSLVFDAAKISRKVPNDRRVFIAHPIQKTGRKVQGLASTRSPTIKRYHNLSPFCISFFLQQSKPGKGSEIHLSKWNPLAQDLDPGNGKLGDYPRHNSQQPRGADSYKCIHRNKVIDSR